MPVTLLMPTSHQPQPSSGATSDDFRQVLAVVDMDAPVEPVIRWAAAESAAHAVPLQVIVLHPRPSFTTDPAIAVRIARRLGQEQRRVVAAVTDAAHRHGASTCTVRLVPLSRIPLRSRLGQARRTVAAQLQQQPSSLLVSAEQLSPGAGPSLVLAEPGPSADLRHVEKSSL
jgi:hypothetical protein